MIEIINLTKRFGNLIAVDKLNIKIPPGKIFGFLGPNGAGKTTTIKIMTGLLKPTEGTVLLNNYDILKEPLKAKYSFGYVPDKAFLYEKLTAAEYLRFILNIYYSDTKNDSKNKEKFADNFESKIEKFLELFGLSQWKDSLIEGFSHGMKQRLLFAAALIHEPSILIVDEPLAGLDPYGIRLLRTIFSDFANKGNTVFLSTHSLSEAEKICNLIGILHKGKLITIGTIDEIKEKASLPNSPLEEIFLQLTTEAENEKIY